MFFQHSRRLARFQNPKLWFQNPALLFQNPNYFFCDQCLVVVSLLWYSKRCGFLSFPFYLLRSSIFCGSSLDIFHFFFFFGVLFFVGLYLLRSIFYCLSSAVFCRLGPIFCNLSFWAGHICGLCSEMYLLRCASTFSGLISSVL